MLDNNASAKIKFWDPSKVLVSKNSKCHLIDHGLKSFNHFCYIWVSPVRWVIYIWKINSFTKIFLSTWKNFLLEFILIKFEQNFYRISKFHGNLIIFMKIIFLKEILSTWRKYTNSCRSYTKFFTIFNIFWKHIILIRILGFKSKYFTYQVRNT